MPLDALLVPTSLAPNPVCAAPELTAAGSVQCTYVNRTLSVEVVRVRVTGGHCLERTLLPGQRMMFQTLPQTMLEVCSGAHLGTLLCEQIACADLAVI